MIPKQKYHNKTGSQYDQENKLDEEHMHVFQEIQQKKRSCFLKGMMNTDCSKYMDNPKLTIGCIHSSDF